MNDRFSNPEIIKLSIRVADTLGIKLPDEDYLMQKLNLQNPVATIVKENNYSLWIDRYYVAYSHEDEVDIHYVYLTRHHISEECNSYQEASLDRNNDIRLPKQIEKQFRNALMQMKKQQQKTYVPKKYQDKIKHMAVL